MHRKYHQTCKDSYKSLLNSMAHMNMWCKLLHSLQLTCFNDKLLIWNAGVYILQVCASKEFMGLLAQWTENSVTLAKGDGNI